MQVMGLERIAEIAGGESYSVAANDCGAVWGWGAKGARTEDGNWAIEARPTVLDGLAGVISVASGSGYSLAVSGDGTLWEWGIKWGHVFGPYSEPTLLPGATGIVAAVAALGQNVAVTRDGTVVEWGQRGDEPKLVSGLSDVTVVATGCYEWWLSCHALALKRDGTVWVWGSNDAGQLGDGTRAGRESPVQVSGLANVIAVAARSDGTPHNLAVGNDGTVWEWPTAEGRAPVQIAGLTDIIAVAEGYQHSLALARDGSVWAWGDNYYGQLGVERISIRTTPVRVSGQLLQ
jgi:alpha-tubulin suppressor-like RCC1 family protein